MWALCFLVLFGSEKDLEGIGASQRDRLRKRLALRKSSYGLSKVLEMAQ